jgi:hypothetical protein
MRRVGEFARGQRAAVKQRAQDVGAGRIADQRRNRSHVENFAHGRTIARRRPGGTAQCSARPKCRRRFRRAAETTGGARRIFSSTHEGESHADMIFTRRAVSPGAGMSCIRSHRFL